MANPLEHIGSKAGKDQAHWTRGLISFLTSPHFSWPTKIYGDESLARLREQFSLTPARD
jgi:hypothetical protein